MVFPMPICYVKRKLDHKKVNKKTEKEIPHDGEIKEVKEMSIEDCWLNGRFVPWQSMVNHSRL